MAEHKHGEMDTSQQEATFNGFIRFSIWTAIISLIFFVILAAAIA